MAGQAGDKSDIRSITLFWWVALGSIATGINIVSLAKIYFQWNLVGVVGVIVHEYGKIRDALFDNLERVTPLVHLTPFTRTFVIGMAIFAGVFVRTLLLARRAVEADFGVVYGVVASLYTVLMIAALFPARTEVWGAFEWSFWIFIVACTTMIFALVIRDKVYRVSASLFLLNAGACTVVALALLALGGAF